MGLDDPDEVLLRVGLLGTGFVAWSGATRLWESGDVVLNDVSLVLMLVTYVAAFGAFVLGLLRPVPAWSRFLVPAVLGLVFVGYVQVDRVHNVANGVLGTTDVRLYMDYAARLIRSGENPYTHDLSPAFELNRAPMNYGTPLVDGDFTGRMAYPALSALVFVPFQWLGLGSIVVYPTFFVLLLGTLFLATPSRFRPLILLPWFIEHRYLLYTLGGVSDHVWALLLVLMIAFWHRPGVRAACFGLACAYKHQPWLLAPFLLIRVWHETTGPPRERIREMARATLISAGVFATVNLPFIVDSPRDWLAGALEPVVAKMILLGHGVAALTVGGWLTVPRSMHTLYMLAALGALLFVYARHFGRVRDLMWIAPGIILWFGARSLTSYWYYSAFPLLLALARAADDGPRSLPAHVARSAWPASAAVGMAGLLVMGSMALISRRTDGLSVDVHPKLELRGHLVQRMELTVWNHTDRVLEPRFAVQSRADQPRFWSVERGPWELGPGEAARFLVATDVPFEGFEPRWGAIVTVSDATDPALRGTVRIGAEVAYVTPGAIPNGDFRLWNMDATHPAFWGLYGEPADAGTVELVAEEGGPPALEFALPAAPAARRVVLDTYVTLPEAPISVRVYLPDSANRFPDPAVLYGFRLVIDERPMLVLFGDADATGSIDGTPYRMLPAVRESWTEVSLDVRHLAEQVGIVPLPVRRHGGGLPSLASVLDFPISALNLQLVLDARRHEGAVQARFGPIRAGVAPDVDARFAAQRQAMAPTLTWLGDYDREARNLDDAMERYRGAVAADPEFGPAWFRLGETAFWTSQYPTAIEAFREAEALDYDPAGCWKGIGWSQYNLGELDDAISSFEHALTQFEARGGGRDAIHLADVHKGLAQVHARAGSCADSRYHWRLAMQLFPQSSEPEEVRACLQPGAETAP